MEFRVAATFTAALGRLPAREQKAVKTTAFDLQMDPAAPGLKFHRIESSRDPNFWSLRVSRDIRIIVHRTPGSLLLAYVDRHDAAYAWAIRRRIAEHPQTGAIQIVEVRERVEDDVPRPMADQGGPRPFAGFSDADMLAIGVPEDWLADVRAATEDAFLDLAIHLPAEAAEALLGSLATGALRAPAAGPSGPSHPDTMRRITVIEDQRELARALQSPWESWSTFLHPAQRALVEPTFTGPARLGGSAGTGKTIVLLHRAARLARSDDARVLLTTFSRPLAHALDQQMHLLASDAEMRRRITVAPLLDVAERLHRQAFGEAAQLATEAEVAGALAAAAAAMGDPDRRFLFAEWSRIIDPWQIADQDAYLAIARSGRGTALDQAERSRLWPVFAAARQHLATRGLLTPASLFAAVADHYAGAKRPFSHILVDEAQDLGIAELRFLSAIAGPGPDSLFFAGDLGQRIYQLPLSWKALGIDIRNRSVTLKINYRTSHQIRRATDRLLPATISDADGIEEERIGTMSTFTGPAPEVMRLPDAASEAAAVGARIAAAIADGIAPGEIAIFVRTLDQFDRARQAAAAAGLKSQTLSEQAAPATDGVAVGTMHLAKGLEFRAVAVMACDSHLLPLQERIDAAADAMELREVSATERQLFYVACTRARERLWVSGVLPVSSYLDELPS
jgi:superfamily I DNA/RNA helicase